MTQQPTQLEQYQAQRIEAIHRGNRARQLKRIAELRTIPNVQPSRTPTILEFCDKPIPNFLIYKS